MPPSRSSHLEPFVLVLGFRIRFQATCSSDDESILSEVFKPVTREKNTSSFQSDAIAPYVIVLSLFSVLRH